MSIQQNFTAENVNAAKDSVNRQRSQEAELSAIKEDCEKVQTRLIEAEEIRKQNAEVDRKLKKERDEKIREQKEKISELVADKATLTLVTLTLTLTLTLSSAISNPNPKMPLRLRWSGSQPRSRTYES